MVMCSKDSGSTAHTFFGSGWMAGNAILCCAVVRATKWDVMYKLFVVCLNCITPQRKSYLFHHSRRHPYDGLGFAFKI